VVDLARTKAALARLDELVAKYPHLTSQENRERLAAHLEEDPPVDGGPGNGDAGKGEV
jgi:hypothetical protein